MMMTPFQVKRFADEHGIDAKLFLREWIGYAKRRIMDLTCDYYGLLEEAQKETEEEAGFSVVTAVDIQDVIRIIKREIKKAESMLNPVKIDNNRITDEDIARAKDYPVDQLVEFYKGKAVAWCHADKSPSLHHNRKGNRAHCFPCGKSYNGIDILMTRDGMTFIEAVKFLTR